MADDTTASIITFHQPPPKQAKTPAERAKAYRQRKKAKAPALPVAAQVSTTPSEQLDKIGGHPNGEEKLAGGGRREAHEAASRTTHY